MLRLRLRPSPGGARLLPRSLEVRTRGEAALIFPPTVMDPLAHKLLNPEPYLVQARPGARR